MLRASGAEALRDLHLSSANIPCRSLNSGVALNSRSLSMQT